MILIVGVIALVWVVVDFLLGGRISFADFKMQVDHLRELRDQMPIATIGLFGLVFIAAAAASLPIATLLALAAGAIFGVVEGMIIVSFSSTIGATLAMLVSRYLLRNWVLARFGERVRALNNGMVRDGAYYLFALRLVPSVPFFVVNLLMGLTTIPVRTYFWVSQVGMLGATIIYVNAGAQLTRIDSAVGLGSPPILASLLALCLFPVSARLLVKRLWRLKTD